MPDMHGNKRLLLVDDDPLVRKSFIRCFMDKNYQLDVAECAQQALMFLEENCAIDIIIADFLMPGKDGVELLQMVQERWPTMTRILFTASSESTRVQQSLYAGVADALIEKPWDQEHILEVVAAF
jgi:two-component system NtrC family sensor kinase